MASTGLSGTFPAGGRGKGVKGAEKATVHSFHDLVPALKTVLYDKSNLQLNKVLSLLEAKTQMPREQITYGLMGLLGIYLIFGSLAQLVCNLIGFGYPAYASVKVIFLLYLYLPQTYGAQIIYEKYLDPLIAGIEKALYKE
ncbi:TB2/DP1, HVA22 family [Onchocerca flexuosa]|uniref:TB2/DP1, HVA22 family n=1 Tax=Onchocerca flexuosa TaxID=387005 RepID=A0A238C4V9_9BILA|nr:TB2/DP1, HVA22 family [Onchocerca flexuosa]